MKVFSTDEIETTALSNVSLSIERGEFVAVTGPSGCGKTTLINILGMLDNPTTGKYYFLDTDVSQYRERQRTGVRKENIGFVFQSFNLIVELTSRENVELPLLYQRIPPAERRRRVDSVLERFGLTMRGNHYPSQLSGGQQQRAAVARAVVGEPQLILADEPTGNLDSKHGVEVLSSLRELNAAGATIVMVTHSPAYARYAHRTIELFDGSIVNHETSEAVHD
jgi:putative ABC transport system ATP-binding protein